MILGCFDADKKVFPNYYILGWYSTGTDAQELDMQIHRAVSLDIVDTMPLFKSVNWDITKFVKLMVIYFYLLIILVSC